MISVFFSVAMQIAANEAKTGHGKLAEELRDLIEQDNSHSLIVAATNHVEILDHALFRRFDDVLYYKMPDEKQGAALLESRLSRYCAKGTSWKRLAQAAAGLSYAEITRATEEVLKDALIGGRDQITEEEIFQTLTERQEIAKRLKAQS